MIEYLRQHEQPFSEAVAVEDKIYFPPFMLADFYVLDTKDNSLKKERFQTQHTEELVSQILECKGEKEYIYRSSLFGFSYFADLVRNKKDIYAKQRKMRYWILLHGMMEVLEKEFLIMFVMK